MKKHKLSPPDSRFVTVEDLAQMLSVCQQTVRNMAKRGQLPRPAYLSKKCVRWYRGDVERWINNLARQEGVRA